MFNLILGTTLVKIENHMDLFTTDLRLFHSKIYSRFIETVRNLRNLIFDTSAARVGEKLTCPTIKSPMIMLLFYLYLFHHVFTGGSHL